MAVAEALQRRKAADDEGALQCLQQARAAQPGDGEILVDLGLQALVMHRLLTAAEALDAALSLDAANPRALYAMARVETEAQRFPEAQARYLSYLRIRPQDASAHYGLGRVYQMQQQTELAVAEFGRSVALQPAQAESYFELGQMALDAHRDDEARAEFAKALQDTAKHGGALTGMGILAYRAKDFAAAQSYLDRAVAAAPDYQPAHYYRGLALRREGKAEASETELATAASLAASQQDKGKPVQPQ